MLPPERWSGSTIGNLPIGHGIAVTPVQMAAAYAAVANMPYWENLFPDAANATLSATQAIARLLLFAFVGCALTFGARTAQAQEEPSAEQLLERVDDLYRGHSSEGTMRVHVKTERWERTLTLRKISDGE